MAARADAPADRIARNDYKTKGAVLTMRLSEDRYFSDLRPMLLALRMLKLEARTRTICTWTGLSRDRIRKLAISSLPPHSSGQRVRHRGRSPQQTGYFFRSPSIHTHASTIACNFTLVGLVPAETISARAFPSVSRGDLLCMAYETYYVSYTDILIDFERAILLATALAQRDEVDLGRCGDCGAMMIVDRLALGSHAVRLCQACRFSDSNAVIPLDTNERGFSEPEQMLLFDDNGQTEPRGVNGFGADTHPIEGQGKNQGSAVPVAPAEGERTISIPDKPKPDDDQH